MSFFLKAITPSEGLAVIALLCAAHGAEQQIPPHAAVITFGFPSASYVPTTNTGAG